MIFIKNWKKVSAQTGKRKINEGDREFKIPFI